MSSYLSVHGRSLCLALLFCWDAGAVRTDASALAEQGYGARIATKNKSTSNGSQNEQLLSANTSTAPPAQEDPAEPRVNFTAGEAPGVAVDSAPGGRSWLWFQAGGAMRKKLGDKQIDPSSPDFWKFRTVKQIGDHDVHNAPKQIVEDTWAAAVRQSKDYQVVLAKLDYDSALPLPLTFLCLGCVLSLITVSISLGFLPCFLCGLCGKCRQNALAEPTEQPPAHLSESKEVENAWPVPRLRPGTLNTVLDSNFMQIALALLSFRQFVAKVVCFSATVGLGHSDRDAVGAVTVLAVDLMLPASKLGLCVIVLVGLYASKECKLAQETVPQDLMTTMREDWSWKVLLPFGPKLLILLGSAAAACVVALLAAAVTVARSFGMQLSTSWWEDMATEFSQLESPQLLLACDIICQQGLTLLFMLKFMLEACVITRVAQAHVDSVANTFVSPTSAKQLQESRKACARLETDVLFKLKGITFPLVGIAFLSWSYAFAVMLEVLLSPPSVIFGHAHSRVAIAESGMKFVAIVVCFCQMPIGLACLLLPASVSDAFDELSQKLNSLRADADDDAQKQIFITEAFLQQSNRGRGLGFMLPGTGMVVNKRMIHMLCAQILGFSSIALSFINRLYQMQKESEEVLARIAK